MKENKLFPPISVVCFYVRGTDTPREAFMTSSSTRAETCTPCLKAGIITAAGWIPPRTGYLSLRTEPPNSLLKGQN